MTPERDYNGSLSVPPGKAGADLEALEEVLIAQCESAARLGMAADSAENAAKREYHRAMLTAEGKNQPERDAAVHSTVTHTEDGRPFTVGELSFIAKQAERSLRIQNDAILVTRTQIDIRRSQLANERAVTS